MTFIVAGPPASLCCSCFITVVCVHTTFAATPNSSPSATEVATSSQQPPALATD